MTQTPAPLSWPSVRTLETAHRESDCALLALDLAFQRQASPDEVEQALHAAARADAHLLAARKEAPSGN